MRLSQKNKSKRVGGTPIRTLEAPPWPQACSEAPHAAAAPHVHSGPLPTPKEALEPRVPALRPSPAGLLPGSGPARRPSRPEPPQCPARPAPQRRPAPGPQHRPRRSRPTHPREAPAPAAASALSPATRACGSGTPLGVLRPLPAPGYRRRASGSSFRCAAPPPGHPLALHAAAAAPIGSRARPSRALAAAASFLLGSAGCS